MAVVSLLIFCLGDVFIDVSGLLKSPFTICVLLISPYKSVHILYFYILVFLYWFSYILVYIYIYIYINCYVFLMNCPLYIISIFVSLVTIFWFEVYKYFVCYNYSHFLWLSFSLTLIFYLFILSPCF